ncbi:hypothetical protein, partial [Psychromonas hadalis]|uniref:hypothetical protein n=1 Tax=Psychromonas hadalis TaxID=211669 RepID=UPI001B7F8820
LISALHSIAIAGYYSIMRLDLSNLPCVKPDHYIKRNGITSENPIKWVQISITYIVPYLVSLFSAKSASKKLCHNDESLL